jgi:hypothetical protein
MCYYWYNTTYYIISIIQKINFSPLNPIQMNTLDNFSKRFLTISISLSVILLSASLFIFSIKTATASSAPAKFPSPYSASENYSPLGIYNGYVYYFYMSGSTIEFYKVKTDVAKDFTENYK